ncbi:hypothetical protein R6Q57_011262 [Mikania cordata]
MRRSFFTFNLFLIWSHASPPLPIPAHSRKAFNGIINKVVTSWNSVIAVCAQHGMSTESLNLFFVMVRDADVKYNVVTLFAFVLIWVLNKLENVDMIR